MITKFVKCTAKNQVSIPKEIADKMGVRPGTLFRLNLKDNLLEFSVESTARLTTHDLVKRWKEKYSHRGGMITDQEINDIIKKKYAKG